jgi:P27 family predicted phage terminase small subunit
MSRPRKSIHDYSNVAGASKAEKRRVPKTKIRARDRLKKVPPPPRTLSPSGAKEWKKLAPTVVDLGTVCRGDLRALEQLCETLGTVTELQVIVHDQGLLLETGTGSYKANPAVKSLETARNKSHRLLVEFGLTPKARNYVSRAPEPEGDNPWSQFRPTR